MKNFAGIARNLSLLIPTVLFVSASAQAQTYNHASGPYALSNVPNGTNNTAMGYSALRYNSGSYNSALGRVALLTNTTGENNTAMGYQALRLNTTGYANTAIGSSALYAVTTGVSNTVVGAGAMGYAIGSNNTVVGTNATPCGACNNTTAVGFEAEALGAYSTALGSTGSVVGSRTRAAGTSSTAVGSDTQAAHHYTTALGSGARATASNSMALGYGAQATLSNSIRIGNTAIVSITAQAPFTNVSDGRYKTNVRQNVPGLEFINKLKPVTFNWRLDKLNAADGLDEFASDPVLGEAREAKARKVQTGFIAQDVEAAARECGFDFSAVQKPADEKSSYTLAYSEFVVPLVKAVQEQQMEIEELQKTVRALSSDRRLGTGPTPTTPQHAGVLGGFWGGAMTLLSAALVLLHLKRRSASAPAS